MAVGSWEYPKSIPYATFLHSAGNSSTTPHFLKTAPSATSVHLPMKMWAYRSGFSRFIASADLTNSSERCPMLSR